MAVKYVGFNTWLRYSHKFQFVMIDNYELDPSYYLTLPGYSWDVMLKMTGVEFKLLRLIT